jgi:NTF2 fold immunity protein
LSVIVDIYPFFGSLPKRSTGTDDGITKPSVRDNGDSWLVYYKLPEDTLGGTPEVIIDKRALKVLRAYHTQ